MSDERRDVRDERCQKGKGGEQEEGVEKTVVRRKGNQSALIDVLNEVKIGDICPTGWRRWADYTV